MAAFCENVFMDNVITLQALEKPLIIGANARPPAAKGRGFVRKPPPCPFPMP
jgi:hypothetical protein